jgi:hypothetical protein
MTLFIAMQHIELFGRCQLPQEIFFAARAVAGEGMLGGITRRRNSP